jgi:hypothetical protein
MVGTAPHFPRWDCCEDLKLGDKNGVPDNVVRIVTENGRTLKFTTHGFEEE